MTLQPQTSDQSRCEHQLTSQGSNEVQQRRTCRKCRLTVAMIHWHRAPDDFILQVLQHARNSRPHLWEVVASQPPLTNLTSATIATNLASSSTGSTVPPPPKAHPKTVARRTRITQPPTHQVVVNVVNAGSTQQQAQQQEQVPQGEQQQEQEDL